MPKVERLSSRQASLLAHAYHDPCRWIWYAAARQQGRRQALLRLERRKLMCHNSGYTSRITKRGVRVYESWLKRHHLTSFLRKLA